MRIPALLAVAALLATLPAQQSKVLPTGMDNVEGPSVLTYPFGRVDTGGYFLWDADLITGSQALITGMDFRPSQATQSAAGYTKPYRVTAYTVPITAAQMLALGSPFLPANLVGTATGTVLFQGPVTVPPEGPLTVAPGPFNINIAFTTPYLFDATQGNLLLLLETTDTTAVTTTYRVDAVQFRSTLIEGIATDIDTGGCPANGSTLATAVAPSSVILGGTIDATVTASLAGTLPLAFNALSLVRQDVDLTAFGLPGCTSRIGLGFVQQLLIDGGTGFPHALWSIPALPAFLGVPLYTQSFGLPPTGSNIAVGNAQALRLGSNTLPVTKSHFAWRTGTSWYQGQVGSFGPVVRLNGVFP